MLQARPFSFTLIIVALCVASVKGNAQCLTTINSFPYTEGFEAAPAWTSGGANNDWAWGAPAHPTINAAAVGNNAWCVGGLTGSFYANNQQSWLESPCFDLSALNYPYISFGIYWETEADYDGAGFQYSTNGGTTWTNLGGFGDDDCYDRNWFNTPNITALNLTTPRQGWSGTALTGGCATGGGSGEWLLASHCLADVPTAAPVKFRFIFGAGSICNTFDGVAIDQVYIGEAPPLEPAFTFTCTSGNTIVFNNSAAQCPENSTWNFDDPGSGASNTATGPQATHTFSTTGSFTVTLTMTGSCAAPATVTQVVTIAELELSSTSPDCLGNPGTATALVTGSDGPFTYAWSPGNGTTGTITGLQPGSYTVVVEASGMCPLQGTVEVEDTGEGITATVDVVDVSCAGANDGSANVAVAGGTPPFTYAWTPDGGMAATATGLMAGSYLCSITDAAGCVGSIGANVLEPSPISVVVSDDLSVCAGASATLTAEASGGAGAFTYTWSPEGPLVSPNTLTTYTVVVTDASGCASEEVAITVSVTSAVEPTFTWDIDSGCVPLCVTFTDASGVAGTRAWSFGNGALAGDVAQTEQCFMQPGVFDATLMITTPEGCTGSWTAVEVIAANDSPLADFGFSPSVATAESPTFSFFDRTVNAAFRQWTFGDPAASSSTEASPVFTYPGVGCYNVTLRVANADGCTASTEGIVCVEDGFALYAPNAFSPNSDGINDEFVVISSVARPELFTLEIFDRWGGLLHTATDPNDPWDGDGTPQGAYIWRIRIRDSQGKLQERQGHVVLLR